MQVDLAFFITGKHFLLTLMFQSSLIYHISGTTMKNQEGSQERLNA